MMQKIGMIGMSVLCSALAGCVTQTSDGLARDVGSYAVVDLSAGPGASSYPVRISRTGPDTTKDTCRTTELWLRRIEGGAFAMGAAEERFGATDMSVPHEVTISAPFYAGVFEITQKQWELVMGTKPSEYAGDTRPVERVSFEDLRGTGAGAAFPASRNVDAGSFFGRLRARTGIAFDLPTEAQWEYACRAGTTSDFNNGGDLRRFTRDETMDKVGRYGFNGYCLLAAAKGPREHLKAGSFPPNRWGLYDMHGNVYEWCLDWSPFKPAKDAVTDPTGPATGRGRRLRGGGWYSCARDCMSSARGSHGLPHERFAFVGARVFAPVR